MRPRFKVLDIVEIGNDPVLAAPGLSGRQAVVTQIRLYADGDVRYSVGSHTDDDEVGGLYDEEDLHAVGERASIDRFRVPGPFRERELVVISADCDEPEIAGRRGEITSGYWAVDKHEELHLGVWVKELGLLYDVEARFLTATGERLPPPAAGRPAKSTRVSEDGDVLGTTGYVIIDDIERYL